MLLDQRLKGPMAGAFSQSDSTMALSFSQELADVDDLDPQSPSLSSKGLQLDPNLTSTAMTPDRSLLVSDEPDATSPTRSQPDAPGRLRRSDAQYKFRMPGNPDQSLKLSVGLRDVTIALLSWADLESLCSVPTHEINRAHALLTQVLCLGVPQGDRVGKRSHWPPWR